MSDPEDDLRELFDRAAEPPSATTLVRLAARAREIPERPRRRRGPGWWAWAAPGWPSPPRWPSVAWAR